RDASAVPGEHHATTVSTVLARCRRQLAHAQCQRTGDVVVRQHSREGLGTQWCGRLRFLAGDRLTDRDGRHEQLQWKDSDEGWDLRRADAVHGRCGTGRDEVVAGMDRVLPRVIATTPDGN